MDTAVRLVTSYLQLNGYFVQTEVPVLERTGERPLRFEARTDLDVLAVRFPSRGQEEPPLERRYWAGVVCLDPELHAPADEMDVIIGEVKEGRSRLNPNLTSPEVLKAALSHTGGCMPAEIDHLVDDLLADGEARARHCHGGIQRLRLVAFGGTRPDDAPADYRVIPLRHVLGFLREVMADNEAVFKVIEARDPTLGTLMLQHKLGG